MFSWIEQITEELDDTLHCSCVASSDVLGEYSANIDQMVISQRARYMCHGCMMDHIIRLRGPEIYIIIIIPQTK